MAALTFLYGTAFTIMFTVLPKLGVVGNSAIMNVEPVFALALAWLILGQAIAPVQVAGALLELLGSDTHFAAVPGTAPAGRAEGSANWGSDPKN